MSFLLLPAEVLLGLEAPVDNMRPQGSDLVLIQLIEKLNKVSTRISKVIRCGADVETDNITLGIKMVDSLVNLTEDIEDAISNMQRPSIKIMTKYAKDWFDSCCKAHREEFATTEFNSLAVFMPSMGMDIINTFHLWGYSWVPQIVNGVDTSPNHPEALALQVIENLWRDVKNEST